MKPRHFAYLAFLQLISTPSHPEELQSLVVATADGPPHMIEYNQSGIDLDVTRLLLNRIKVKPSFKFVGLGRARVGMKSGQYEAMVPTFLQQDESGFYVSTPVIAYKPTVFSLSRNQFSPKTLNSIKGHSLASFQGAKGYFGEAYSQVANSSPYYSEIAAMKTIPLLIYKERFDYAVLDKYIFYYYFRLNNKQRDISVFAEHDLIPAAFAAVAFTDKHLRDHFNEAAKGFIQSEEYKSILKRYVGSVSK